MHFAPSLARADGLIAAGRCDDRRMVEHLFARFGRESVLVLLYEDLRADPARFVAALCAFMGVTAPQSLDASRMVNAAPSPSDLLLRRRLNALGGGGPLRRHALRLARDADRLCQSLIGRPLVRIDVEAAAPRIAEAYRDGNRQLAGLIGRPLDGLGYPS